MSLFDMSRELFAYLVSFREAAPTIAAPSLAKVRADLDSHFARMENMAKSSPVTSAGYELMRYALVGFADEVLTTSGWKQGGEWARNCLEKRYYNTQEAGRRFFRLAARLDGAPDDAAAIFYLCLALGFHGPHPPDDPKLQMVKEHLAKRLPAPELEIETGSALSRYTKGDYFDQIEDEEEELEPSPRRNWLKLTGGLAACAVVVFVAINFWSSSDEGQVPPDPMQNQPRPTEQPAKPAAKVRPAKQQGIGPAEARPGEPAKPTAPAPKAVASVQPPASPSPQTQTGAGSQPSDKPANTTKPPESQQTGANKPAETQPANTTKKIGQAAATKPAPAPKAEPTVETAASDSKPPAQPSQASKEAPEPKAQQSAANASQGNTAPPESQSGDPMVFFLQIGTFNGPVHASDLAKRLKRHKLPALVVPKARKKGNKKWHVVVTGPYVDQQAAQLHKDLIAEKLRLTAIMREKPRKEWP
jgi:type IV/VI secretion system ImpK/VasF family protein